MAEAAFLTRGWRLDSIDADSSLNWQTEAPFLRCSGGAGSRTAPSDVAAPTSAAVGSIRRWTHVVRSQVRAQLGRFAETRAKPEQLLHRFATIVAMTDDAAVVEAALVRAVRMLISARRVELIPRLQPLAECRRCVRPAASALSRSFAEIDSTEPEIIELPLRFGASVNGRVRVWLRTGITVSAREETIDRLSTLCTVASGALENLSWRRDWHWDTEPALPARATTPSSTTVASPIKGSVAVHDATFLSAVLPFALNQARRHREPLSVLCIAVDRLNAILDLMGRAAADRLVRRVSETVASLIRSSDIVARFDDDRVAVVLPRAPVWGAVHVAEKIRRAFAEEGRLVSEMPGGVTVSIGVATFPTCADDDLSLIDAADLALTQAQQDGRNRFSLASPRTIRTPEATAIACPS
jgi:diguanylate cyclase (GGDEF)-like protein